MPSDWSFLSRAVTLLTVLTLLLTPLPPITPVLAQGDAPIAPPQKWTQRQSSRNSFFR